MEIQEYLDQKKNIYQNVLNYLEIENSNGEDFQDFLKDQNIFKDNSEFTSLLILMNKISKHHQRCEDFDHKINQFFDTNKENIKNSFSNSEIFKIFKSNKRILLYIIQNEIIEVDEQVLNYILYSNERNYTEFFYPEIKKIYSDIKQPKTYEEDNEEFENDRQIGENHFKICKLIREDLIEEFVSFVNQTNFPLNSQIQTSIFETNSFLIGKNPTLIEYATFFGSIQIFKYLQYHNIELTSSLWLYAIHSNDPEFITILEDNYIESNQEFVDCLIESIKCHHNEISYYIQDKINESKSIILKMMKKVKMKAIRYYNYLFFPNEFPDYMSYYNLYRYNHNKLVDLSKKLFLNPEEIKIIVKNSDELGIYDKEGYYLTYEKAHSSDDLSNGEVIEKLIIPNYLNVSFAFCKEAIIPSPITSINWTAFNECKSLKKVLISSSVTSINDKAFYKCKSLKKILFPFSIKSIGDQAFCECSKLIQISIPSSVTSIGNDAFSYCSSLAQVSILSSVIKIGYRAFSGCSSLAQIIILSSVVSIGQNAFEGCSSLTQITIPSSVTSIGQYTFCKCSSLTQITIPSSVTSIGKGAFAGCSSLKQITIPSSVTSIEDYAFGRCSSLTQISILSSLTSIGQLTFCKCSSLTQITIPSSVISIEDHAFDGCSSLKQISIPSSVTSIGKGAFAGCSSLKQISIPSSVTSIEDYAFGGCSSLTQISIPSSVITIGFNAFSKCLSLKQILISSADSIEEDSLMACTSLTQIIIPSSFQYISDLVFDDCSSLKQVSIPNSVISKGNYSFNKCISITDFTFNGGVKTIDILKSFISLVQFSIPTLIQLSEKGVLNDCLNFSFFYFDCNSFALYQQSSKQLFISTSQVKKNIFPDNIIKQVEQFFLLPPIVSIEEESFVGFSSLKIIEFPSTLKSIGKNAFYRCTLITEIKFPESVISIGDSSFEKCSSLKKIKLPQALENIGFYAFADCTSIENISIPKSVNFIGDFSFDGCSSLKQISIPSSFEDDIEFFAINPNAIISFI